MVEASQIKEHMPVVCGMDSNTKVSEVDGVEGNSIKLTKDETGQHHYIPLSFIKKVENGVVQLAFKGGELKNKWSTKAS